MPSKDNQGRPGRPKLGYSQATTYLLMAFYCITGNKPEDQRVRNSIEAALTSLNRAELAAAPRNIAQFTRKETRTDN